MNPYAEFASLSYRERMILAQAPKKFCGQIAPHEAHGWICARRQHKCMGVTAVEARVLDDPIELVKDLARGAYIPKSKRPS